MPNLSASLHNALSGLATLGRVSETIAANVSNASTPGYAPREAVIAQRVIGSVGYGASVVGIQRYVDPFLLADRRFAEAELAKTSEQTAFYATLEARIGLPDDAGSLSGRLAQFGAELIQSASRPDSEGRLQGVLDAAKAVATHLNNASDAVQMERMRADAEIATGVDFINTTLDQIVALNGAAMRSDTLGHDRLAIMDQRQRLIDDIAQLIPVREVTRDNGTVALFTPGGSILLDGTAARLEFSPAGTIVPELNVGAGLLSGLTINGQAVSTNADKGPIAGGKLAALFDVRDVQAPAVQTRLDAFARDLISRFESPAVDPTLGIGDPGLFTDDGSAFVVADEVGLSARISVNALVDPSQGGELWRLRDGLGAATPGQAGDATLLNALSDAFNTAQIPASGGFAIARSASGLAGELVSSVAAAHTSFASTQSFSQARAETLTNTELQNGVDTDTELQRLLLVERAFAANAKVISTIDELIQTLIRI